ncbi:MAG: hypothetical protein NVS2B9_01260 [Myxococcales bacterium]
MKLVVLLLLPCAAVLGCVSLPPPLPPGIDPANPNANEAPSPRPSSTLARERSEPSATSRIADAGPPPAAHHHHEGMQMGDAGAPDGGARAIRPQPDGGADGVDGGFR